MLACYPFILLYLSMYISSCLNRNLVCLCESWPRLINIKHAGSHVTGVETLPQFPHLQGCNIGSSKQNHTHQSLWYGRNEEDGITSSSRTPQNTKSRGDRERKQELTCLMEVRMNRGGGAWVTVLSLVRGASVVDEFHTHGELPRLGALLCNTDRPGGQRD